MKKTHFLISLVSLILTIAIHSYLALEHFDVQYGLSGDGGICNLGGKFNCQTVAASTYSSFMGVPMAVWGIVVALLSLVFLVIRHLEWSEHPIQLGKINTIIAAGMFGVSIIMGGISFFVLDAYCIFCISAYAVSLVHFVNMWISEGSPNADTFSSLWREQKWVSYLLIGIYPVGYFTQHILADRIGANQLAPVVSHSIQSWNIGNQKQFDLTKGLLKGPQDGKMVIVEFADFLCSHCKNASSTFRAFLASHPNAQLNFKFFPLDGTCNDKIERSGDGKRCELAYLTFCAEKIGQKGWKAHDRIFEFQESLLYASTAIEFIDQTISLLALPSEEIKACMSSPETKEAVKAMAAEGAAAGVEGTPAIYVNGRQLSLGQILPVLSGVYTSIQKESASQK